MCFCTGVDILKLVAAQVGNQWVDIYQSLANATEREVAAFSNGYSSDHERAYAALQHWTIRDSGANLAKLINALHRLRRIDVVEKIRCVMEDNPQVRFCPRSTQLKTLQTSLFWMSEEKTPKQTNMCDLCSHQVFSIKGSINIRRTCSGTHCSLHVCFTEI